MFDNMVKIGDYRIKNIYCKHCECFFKTDKVCSVVEVKFNQNKKIKNIYLSCPSCGEADLKFEINQFTE